MIPRFTAALLCTALFAGSTLAQVGPEQTVRKILDEIAEEMAEIDRLLLESSRSEATEGMERNAARIKELFDKTNESQDRTIRGIDRLIEELQDMMQSSSSSSSSDDQQQQQQQQQSSGQPDQQSQREQSQTPDMVEQGEQGEQPKPQPEPGQQPQDGRPEEQPGSNRPAGQAPEDGSEDVDRDSDADHWGDLPRYIQFLHSRGGIPEVPEKYRRAYEAYQRRANQTRPSDSR